MGRVELDDSLLHALTKMSEGNPGALRVLLELMDTVPQIDPDSALGGLLYVLRLDDLKLYGSAIWMLYKDVCGEDVAGMVALLRANQLGQLPSRELRRIVEEDEPYDFAQLVPKIREDVPDFLAQDSRK